MSEHEHECHCVHCLHWFETMQAANATGRCGRCNKPIDDHPKDGDGIIEACPQKAHA